MAEKKTSNSSGSSSGASKYVLVAGNDASNLVYTSLLLQKLNYHIMSANTAEEALEMVNVILPILIITDLTFSRMNATQMIQVLKQKPRTASVPIIIKVEQPSPQIEQKCREIGAVACIRKPVDPEELYRVVQAVIEPIPRTHIRIPTRLSVVLDKVPLDLKAGECATVISSRGMFIQTLNLRPKRTVFAIQVIVDDHTITAEAKVVYSYNAGEGPQGVPGMGLFFSKIAQEDQDRLQRYINETVTSGILPRKS
jgi:CheY-like chemotaxis protein